MPFEDPSHLPNQQGGRAAEPDDLPRQRRGTTPQMHGRYPDFDVLEHASHWDEPTRKVVLARLDPPEYRHFKESARRTLEAFCDTVMAQDREPRIPVLRFVDQALHEGRSPGFRYDGMPADGEVWRRLGDGLDDEAGALGADTFADLPQEQRDAIVERFSKAELRGGVWDTMPVKRAWAVTTSAILTAYYAHPWAWNEIGFGGPAYPRGYMRLGIDQHEPWEGREAEGLAADFQTDIDETPEMRP
ncbi:MAG TPA: gluconate 2-dehydrogenase subunit 3 family protein [Gaiellales bacterium]